uniref:Uncharacterized protein n=1 Tax=Mycena chlorophos TaxID=658473 RepID=A0ABQ0L8K6_MYCCL|nr:predicted protein [Mycena chlorophos]
MHFGQDISSTTTTISTTTTVTHNETDTDLHLHGQPGLPIGREDHGPQYVYYRICTRDSEPLNSSLAFQSGDSSLGRAPRQRLRLLGNVRQGELLNCAQFTFGISKLEGNHALKDATVHNADGPMDAGDKIREWYGSSPDDAIMVVVGMSAVQAKMYFGNGPVVQNAGNAPTGGAGSPFGVTPGAAAGGFGSPEPPNKPSPEEIAATGAQMREFQAGMNDMMGMFMQRNGAARNEAMGGMGGGFGGMGGGMMPGMGGMMPGMGGMMPGMGGGMPGMGAGMPGMGGGMPGMGGGMPGMGSMMGGMGGMPGMGGSSESMFASFGMTHNKPKGEGNQES